MPGGLSTHVLDKSKGLPAPGIKVTCFELVGSSWRFLSDGTTNEAGRIPELVPKMTLKRGTYKVCFETEPYFRSMNVESFFLNPEITFEIENEKQHYHVPLLCCQGSYSTYRGA